MHLFCRMRNAKVTASSLLQHVPECHVVDIATNNIILSFGKSLRIVRGRILSLFFAVEVSRAGDWKVPSPVFIGLWYHQLHSWEERFSNSCVYLT